MNVKLFLLILLILPISLFSQTQVSGNQSGVWIAASSPYQVIGETTIPTGDTLIIEPGVEINFQGHYKFIVNGNLQAVGTETDSIIFTTDNISTGWAGIRFVNADTTSLLSRCVIKYGKSTGSWPDNSGGGVSLWDSDITIENCYFTNNFSENLGGGLFCWGSNPTVNYSVFRNNDCSYDGGAIYLYFSDANINYCEVIENHASYYGAGLAFEHGSAEIKYSLFAHNDAFAEAGVMHANFSNIILTNCTLADNTTDWGWGGALYLAYSDAIITNCIFWNNPGNSGDIHLDIQATAVVNYTDILGTWSGIGNIATNPLFEDAPNINYSLTENSPCIDTAAVFFVSNGDTLVNLAPGQYSGSAPDMGAYEYSSVGGPTIIDSGDVSGTWTNANSPYYIGGDITIPNDSTLIIEPGVLVEFQGHYELDIQGKLLAIGTEADSIVFTINDTTGFSNINISDGSWHGIRFINTPVTNDSTKIQYCKFEYGKAIGYSPASAGSGGAIYISNFSKLNISNSTICNSIAFLGGGIAFEDSSGGYLKKNRLNNNISLLQGGGIYCVASSPIIKNSIIEKNVASSGGGISCWYGAEPFLKNIIVSNNWADIHAGGIYCNFGANPILNNVLINNNIATYGAGINCGNSSNPTLLNITIINNHAYNSAGGISCGNNSNPDLINVTISNNTAGYWGGALYCYDSHPRLANSILWNNSPDEVYFSDYSGYSNSIMFTNSNIDSGQHGIVTNNNATVFWQTGNISSDPMFADTAIGDFTLQAGSPCIDAGIQDTAVVYNNGQDTLFVPLMEYLGNAPDMGSHESPYISAIEEMGGLPKQFSLKQNYPNPFNPTTTIEFALPKTEFVSLKIYNLLGQEIAMLVADKLTPMNYKYKWDASGFASGIYYYILRTSSGYVQSRKLVLLK